MEIISITIIIISKIIHLPSIKRNKINLSANVSKEFDEVKTNRINRLSFPHKINNILNKRKTNEIKIFTPIKSRLTNVLNNLDNFNSFNSLDLSKTKDRNKYNYFYNSNNISTDFAFLYSRGPIFRRHLSTSIRSCKTIWDAAFRTMAIWKNGRSRAYCC